MPRQQPNSYHGIHQSGIVTGDRTKSGSLDRLLSARQHQDKHLPQGFAPFTDQGKEEDFDKNDVEQFECLVRDTIDLVESSSTIPSKKTNSLKSNKRSTSVTKSRNSKKRNLYDTLKKIEGKLPGFFKCLKGHTKHTECHQQARVDDVIIAETDVKHNQDGHANKYQKRTSDHSAEEESEERLRRELEHKNGEIQRLQAALAEFSVKLAAEMEKNLSADETSLENISIKDRPMTIADEYSLIQSNEWLNAKSALDDLSPKSSEAAKLQLLCDVINVSKRSANMLYTAVIDNVRRGMYQCLIPDYLYQANRTTKTAKPPERKPVTNDTVPVKDLPALPSEVATVIGDYLRRTCRSANINGIYREVLLQLKLCDGYTSFGTNWKAIMKNKAFESYVHAVCRLAWKMSIQRPPMTLEFAAERRDREQELHWNSRNDPDARVCVVFPILTHGEQVMGKGKIFLH